MKDLLKISLKLLFIGSLIVLLSGCTVVLQKRHTSDIEKIESLSEQLENLKMTEEEYLKLKEAYNALKKSLSQEIDDEKVSLGLARRGLVITIVESVLFDSGKAELRSESYKTLDKVADVCRKVVADREVGVEGHTDNQPIKYSGWKSNWELSTARATSVLHYLIGKGISGERLSATGFGEFRPVTSNQTPQGQQKNRRVEIVVLPAKIDRNAEAIASKYVK